MSNNNNLQVDLEEWHLVVHEWAIDNDIDPVVAHAVAVLGDGVIHVMNN
jgi:hypothetical protein